MQKNFLQENAIFIATFDMGFIFRKQYLGFTSMITYFVTDSEVFRCFSNIYNSAFLMKIVNGFRSAFKNFVKHIQWNHG